MRSPLPAVLLLVSVAPLAAQQRPLLPDSVVASLAHELSGETAKRNLEGITREHRMRGSRAWHRVAQFVVDQLASYGIPNATIEQFPADGQRFYGTQRSRPPWDVDFAELWELAPAGGGWARQTRLASFDAMPITLAQDSESGEATADLVDVGAGTTEADYAGRDVKGKIVLASAQPGPVAPLAVERHGAVGIVSYAQNQHTAWWGEDDNLIRWGHLDAFSPIKTMAFMVSLKQARAFKERLARGERIRLEARVRGGKRPGNYELVTATIPGADPARAGEEIAFSCHLDHQRPGANDNASGCVTILEAARTLAKLIAEKRIPPPARTLRFIWPPEIEGSLALLTTKPELAKRIKAVIHLDMVGGGPITKATFHVTRGPVSLPTFVSDVAAAFGDLVNRESARFAGTGAAEYPMVAPEGGKEPLQADFADFTMGSDHEVYSEASFGIPSIYMNDWPDRYIHTNFDAAANIDPTKLERVAFITAASGYFLANVGSPDLGALTTLVRGAGLRRIGTMVERRASLSPAEAASLTRHQFAYERNVMVSIERFLPVPTAARAESDTFWNSLEKSLGTTASPNPPPTGDGLRVYRRNPDIKGPMSTFAYDYLIDHYGSEPTGKLRLLRYESSLAGGEVYSYEVLNFVDGRRTAQAIRDAVSAGYGSVPLDLVVEYLEALKAIGVVSRE